MKQHFAAVALMFNVGVAGVYAQQNPVKMTFSGTGGASAVSLPYSGTNTGEQNLAGTGTLGQYTFRIVRATATSPQSPPPSTCGGPFIPSVAGAGMFRFQDGSLLKVSLIEGGDCIDLVAHVGHCTMTFQVTGGTGRFEGATGVITLTETAQAVADASGNAAFFTETGEFTGTVYRAAMEEGRRDNRP